MVTKISLLKSRYFVKNSGENSICIMGDVLALEKEVKKMNEFDAIMLYRFVGSLLAYLDDTEEIRVLLRYAYGKTGAYRKQSMW